MARIGREGASPVVSPDGPVGPYRRAKPGALIVAREAGIPLQPWAVAGGPPWRLRGRWDRHVVPLPFAAPRGGRRSPSVVAPRRAAAAAARPAPVRLDEATARAESSACLIRRGSADGADSLPWTPRPVRPCLQTSRPHTVTKIKFGTDGWRAAIAEDYTFHNVRRCARGVAEYLQQTGRRRPRRRRVLGSPLRQRALRAGLRRGAGRPRHPLVRAAARRCRPRSAATSPASWTPVRGS